MKNKKLIIVLLFFFSALAYGFGNFTQKKIDRIIANIESQITMLTQVRLDYSTANRVPVLDVNKDLVASDITDTELDYLDNATQNIQVSLDNKVDLTTTQTIAGDKTFTDKIVVSSTTKSSTPCGVVTNVQRDAIATPEVGSCVYSSDDAVHYQWDGTKWTKMGEGGGVFVEQTQASHGFSIGDAIHHGASGAGAPVFDESYDVGTHGTPNQTGSAPAVMSSLGIAYKFIAPANGEITSFTAPIAVGVTNLTASTFVMTIHPDAGSGITPDETITLYTSDNSYDATVSPWNSNNYTDKTFTFTGATLTSGLTYWLTVFSVGNTDVDASQRFRHRFNTGLPADPFHEVSTTTNGGTSWSTITVENPYYNWNFSTAGPFLTESYDSGLPLGFVGISSTGLLNDLRLAYEIVPVANGELSQFRSKVGITTTTTSGTIEARIYADDGFSDPDIGTLLYTSTSNYDLNIAPWLGNDK